MTTKEKEILIAVSQKIQDVLTIPAAEIAAGLSLLELKEHGAMIHPEVFHRAILVAIIELVSDGKLILREVS